MWEVGGEERQTQLRLTAMVCEGHHRDSEEPGASITVGLIIPVHPSTGSLENLLVTMTLRTSKHEQAPALVQRASTAEVKKGGADGMSG